MAAGHQGNLNIVLLY